ncbi:UNVERIFIED_CONTAM: Serine/threonine-protein kinase TOR [Sesamum calycinum]|uniref:non-specific serine/threonine protein kinase n=1 Tax=Sesamum calycinum TaxID=2727403 RepID=A0AAW2PPX5_9LAMI
MATTSQSIRYIGPAPATNAGNMDALNRVLAELCVRGNPKDGAASALRRLVEEQARDLSGEAFSRFMDQLYDRVTSLLESNEVAENLGALRAIDELIDVGIGENAVKVAKIANYMRTAFEAKREPETLVVASKVLGHLARAGGAMTADEVERLVKIALDWLRGDRVEYRRFAAVLILKEMAENASTVFNVHVSEFVDAIWVALRDPKLDWLPPKSHDYGSMARILSYSLKWVTSLNESIDLLYYRMFEATQDGLGRNAPVHSIHGSLLAVGELLRNTGEFMMSRYREVAEIVLRYLEHRDRLVRLSITSLLPRIAHFLRDRFVTNYLTICMKHILHVLKIPAEAASGFIALGEMAGALDGELINYLPTITSHLRDAIAPRRGRPSMEALACVGNIAKAMGPSMEPHVRSLLDAMFSVGLSSTLVEALENITASIPSLLPTIQVRLLECISGVLSRNQQVQSRPSAAIARTSSTAATIQVSELSGSALVQLALQTLARFNFKGHDLLEFARESVVVYLEDEDGGTRKDAALCCCKLMANSLSGISSAQFSSSRTSRAGGKRRRLVEEIVEKLLIAAVADADVTVRRSIFSSLHESGGFDDYLAQADCLTAVFAALNDEDFEVREFAISVAGRLSEKNPAYVLPALRRHLIQLLTYLKQSADSKCREESAKLLGCLIRNCERLILPYIAPIHKDILRLLTLWFNHGATSEVQMALQKGFSLVNINTWLVVLPQIIARIHSNNHAVRELIQSLLVRIGQSHPQALMYPLLVACKSISNLRKQAAQEVVDKVRQHSGVLVDEAQLVSTELIRVAILWHEMWHEALEEASRLYFGEHNIEGMLNVLEPLHEMLEEGAMRNNTTKRESLYSGWNIFAELVILLVEFTSVFKAIIHISWQINVLLRLIKMAYRHELLEAYECCMKYRRTGKDAELTQAWDLYYHVFRRIDKQLQTLTTLDLQSVSPELLECRDLKLAVPGTYKADSPVVTIASFAPQLVVITSKQRPRKLTINGSDGEDYAFLLKGHEDLRQDERVMQLFGLVNTLLGNSRETAEKDLSIQRYSVIPLSPNSGLIGWVPNCDTLHHLIREYRDARKITLNQEHKLMLSFAPDYDHLPLIAKVEVFEYALQNTEGNDLARVLWLKSRTSEVWLDRRTNYTRSLAVMSMVGYLLGLGDRHPSNLMLHRYSGKILHIDFGDCFEASMNREKFPEKVPFRLTRMLVKAMEVSGIEGNFRSTCGNVMQVLRSNKDSVMAMMEAFVHDPLINWRLFNFNEVPQMSTLTSTQAQPVVNGEESAPNRELLQPQRGVRERELLQAVNQLGDANEVLNERAVVVMARMSNKLTGRDFSACSSLPSSSIQHSLDHSTLISGDAREADHGLSVKLQVQKLILQATSHENLCQNYVGPMPLENQVSMEQLLFCHLLSAPSFRL